MTSVVECVRADNVRMLRLLVAIPVPATELTAAMVMAAQLGHSQCTEILLTTKITADNITDNSGSPLVKLAAEAGHTDVVRVLLNEGCSVDLQNRSGATALHGAARLGQPHTARVLLEAGADSEVRDYEGHTPLLIASLNIHRSIGVVKVLLEAKCNPNVTDRKGKTALHYCAQKAVGVDMLLGCGADPNVQDVDKNTPLLLAASEGFDNIIKSLLNHGADANISNSAKKTALHFLGQKNHWDAIASIVTHGGDLDIVDSLGNSALWYAVNHNRPEAVRELLHGNCCANNGKDSEGKSVGGNPLETGLQKKLFDICKLLILAGCELDALHRWVSEYDATAAARNARSSFWDVVDPEDSSSESEDEDTEKEAMQWFADWLHKPHTLRQTCRIWLRRHLGSQLIEKGAGLPLPPAMYDYVMLREIREYEIVGYLM